MNILKVGDKVPEFSAIDQHNNMINFSDFIGKKLVVFFYPRANTPGCTRLWTRSIPKTIVLDLVVILFGFGSA